MDEIQSKKEPFVADLPSNGEKYVPVLNRENASVLKSGVVSLRPGESIGSHNTGNKEELILILEGEGSVVTEEKGALPVAQGQVAFNPPNTEHNVVNSGSTLLRYIYIVAHS